MCVGLEVVRNIRYHFQNLNLSYSETYPLTIAHKLSFPILALGIYTGGVTHDRGVIGATAFFAFAAIAAYAGDLYFRFREWKDGKTNQGNISVNQGKSADVTVTV